MEKKYYIKTYGCQMNDLDGMQMGRLLAKQGYEATLDPEEASVVLVNTCSVREKASQKVYSDVGRFRSLKLKRPDLVLGVTGCQAQAEGAYLQKRFPYLDLVIGPDHTTKLPELVDSVMTNRRKVTQVGFEKPQDYEFVNLLPDENESHVKAFITIMKGCDNFCSFCIVPYVRGREVCRSPEEIVAEAKELAQRGTREVMLLGQNVNSYGVGRHSEESIKNKNPHPMIPFASLLQRVADESEIARIRFTTSHPKDLSDELIGQFSTNVKLAKHFHLPVQSGSDTVLERMYRGYTRDEYLERLNSLRKACPELAVSTDIIVGFPGETEDDFQSTLDLLEEIRYDSIFSFVYSSRPKTTAALYFEDDIPLEIKQERLQRLQSLQNRITLEKNQECVGKILEVLVEGSSRQGESYFGKSSQNHTVHLGADENDIGAILKVKISHAGPNSLIGEKL